MVANFQTKQSLWILRRLISKLSIPIICCIIVFATPIFQKSALLSFVFIGVAIFVFLVQFLQAKTTDIYCLKFDDICQELSIISYKYGFCKMETYIPYNKLWYIKGSIRDIPPTEYSTVNIQMRDNYLSPYEIDFYYVRGIMDGTFSREQFNAILNKLGEVGHEYK